MRTVTITVGARPEGGKLLIPAGVTTPHTSVTRLAVAGASTTEIIERETGQRAIVASVAPGAAVEVSYTFGSGALDYPKAMFALRDNRFVRAAGTLAEEARDVAQGPDPVAALAQHVKGQFDYGHPDTQFYDGFDHIPQLCSITAGSCVDINAYFIACLRAAGIEAGYVTGYFFPDHKCDEAGQSSCEDMHCWVVTRCGQGTREWDIAHHMKAGLETVNPGLNPTPGWRVAVAHSMGLSFPELGLHDFKLMSEPMWIGAGELLAASPQIRGVNTEYHPAHAA